MGHKSQNVNCQNCKKDFIIEPEDFSFYEKIKVPSPTWCPECRQQRRYAWRNERTLYRRDCDLCGKSTVTIYSPNKDLKVYCLKCWWGDDWDPSSYGRDFDFNRSFFEQYHELQKVVPRMALLNVNSINSEYTNHSGNNKNVYLSSVCFDDENVFYSAWVMKSRNLMDSNYIYNGGEKIYECIDSQKIYDCQYSILIENCTNCFYCYDCRNCDNCFLSSNLRNKSYIFKNVQYTREVYLDKLKEYNLSSYKIRQELYQEFLNFLKNKYIHKNINGERNYNCLGNMLFGCKNTLESFDCDSVEDSKYIFSASPIKTSMDSYHVGWGTELSYELHACKGSYNGKFCHLCYDNQELEYCDTCHNSVNLFGCISINKGEYMILNKKYTKEEYLELKEKIIEHMKKGGEYGEFFPLEFSEFSYNKSNAMRFFNKTKEEVLAQGFNWDDSERDKVVSTIKGSNLSEMIDDVNQSILKEVIECILCQNSYNINKGELDLLKKLELPLPRKCHRCRENERFNRMTKPGLFDRKCDKCYKEIKSAYAPDRPEIVYCEDCYKKEIY